jgi:DNA-binding transcriptional LysR family regulator
LKLVDTRGPVEDSLRSRACDVVITPLNPLVSYDLHSQPLFDDTYLCYFDSKVVTPKRVSGHYLDMRHARVEFSRGDRSLIDDILRKKDQARDIAVVAPSFESLPQLMRDTALVATLPSRLAHSLFYGFGTCRVPFPSPTLRFQMIWHKTTHEAPKYRWFRSLIQNSNKL